MDETVESAARTVERDAGSAHETDAAPATTVAAPGSTASDIDGADTPRPDVEESTMPDEELLYDLADLFKVFSDTTRIKILYSLYDTPLPVGRIAETIGATQSAVSHQLRILKQARLVRFDRDGRSLIYSLADDHVHTMLAQGMSHICE